MKKECVNYTLLLLYAICFLACNISFGMHPDRKVAMYTGDLNSFERAVHASRFSSVASSCMCSPSDYDQFMSHMRTTQRVVSDHKDPRTGQVGRVVFHSRVNGVTMPAKAGHRFQEGDNRFCGRVIDTLALLLRG